MSEFKTYHPIVNFMYFVFVIGFSCFFMHPVCLGISLVSGVTYSVMLKGVKQVRKSLIYMVPMLIFMALLNPLFNHRGVSIIAYLPGGNPITLESVIYGICTAFMIVSVICHFTCYNEIMTSDKFIYLFGRIIPAMSLIISMTLRFVPRFLAQLKIVTNAQKCLGTDISTGSILKRVRCGVSILSVMTSWALENAIETSDSMKARGYGLPGRTSFSVFRFDKRDKSVLIFLLLSGAYVIIGSALGAMEYTFFPYMKSADASLLGISVCFVYLLLCMCPVIIEIREVIRWNALKSKI